MLQATAATKTSNEGKRHSTAYEDHTGMLHKLSAKGWGRLEAAGVTVDYMDVFQHMSESFVHCQRSYDPTKGFAFSTYYGRSCWNNFNKWAEKLIDERHELGMVSVETLERTDDPDADVYDFMSNSTLYEDMMEESVEERLSARQESHRAARMLSNDAKRVVAQLVQHSPELLAYVEQRNTRMLRRIVKINLWVIFDFLEIPRPRAAKIRAELESVYGVEL